MDAPLTAHRSADDLLAGLATVAGAPARAGRLELVVRRPAVGEREVLTEGTLSVEDGLVGDDWLARGSRSTADGAADPLRQLTIMNSRAAALVAGPVDRWPLCGDQLYVDLDISEANLPAGSRLRVGATVVEITEPPHTGCAKFTERFGLDAMRVVNSPEGRSLRLRRANARVVTPGRIRVGDPVTVA